MAVLPAVLPAACRPGRNRALTQRPRPSRIGENGAGGLHATVGELEDPPEPGTDAALLAAGHPTLTELTPLRECPGVLERLELGE